MSSPRHEEFAPQLIYTNPVFDGYFADPFVFESGGSYYAVGTGPCLPGTAFPVLSSTDLVHWIPRGGALVRRNDALLHYWAPEVAEQGGTFYMYYSVGTSDERHELRVATSVCPEGPYNEQERPLLDPASACFAIDPSPFRDVDGRWYLFYARDFLDSDGDTRPGTALVLAPLLEMLRVSDDFTLVMRARHDWQRYQAGRPMYGGIYDWHTLEGPCPVRRGRYYCLYSGGNWQNDSYGIDFVSADSVQGPWRDTNDGSGPRVLRTVPGRMIGPGHNSIVSGPGGRDLIAYHAWDVEMTARRLCLDGLVWTDDGPRSLGPNWTRQPMG